MGIVGQRMKAGRRYVTFGCSAHYNRGAAICTNALTVSELKLNRALVGAIRGRLTDEDVVGAFVDRFKATLSKRLKEVTPDGARLDSELWAIERSIENLTTAVANAGWSDALGDRLRREEARRAQLQAARTALRLPADLDEVPDAEEVVGYLDDLLGSLTASPEKGREVLRRYVGSVVMHPDVDGDRRAYRATGAFDLAVLIGQDLGPGTKRARNEKTPVLSDQGGVLVKDGCGGRI
jgi:hypothetical protein